MKTEANPEARALRYEATKHLRKTENIRRALLWAKEHPEELQTRIDEFDITIRELYQLYRNDSQLDPNLYPNLIELRNSLGHPYLLHSFAEITQVHKEWRDNREPHPLIEAVQETFSNINQNIESGEWKFPVEIISSKTKCTT